MEFVRNLSLKIKLMTLLVAVTCSMLSVYGFLALRDFEKDKVAYVLDSSLAQSRSSALQIQTEVGFFVERVRFLMRGFSNETNDFHSYTKSLYPSEQNLDGTWAFTYDTTEQTYKLKTKITKDWVLPADEEKFTSVFLANTDDLLSSEVLLTQIPNSTKWALGLLFKNQQEKPTLIWTILSGGKFLGIFDTTQFQDSYLIHKNGKVVFSPKNPTYNLDSEDLKTAIDQIIQKAKSPEGVKEFQGKNKTKWLSAYAKIGFGDLQIISFIKKDAALEAVKILFFKSALFLCFLFFLTTILSVLFSTTLTSSLKELANATLEIAKGNFAVFVDIRGKDEIGTLSSGFNKMAYEIQRLMKDTAEKTRVEGELKTAQLVQSTLFPREDLNADGIEIRGFYQPASECSGDWWFYKRIGHRTIFCIGDATGHGVPAALLTAAARSTASTLENFPDIPLSQMMSIFNQSIINTAQGQVMMTFFLGAYDHNTGLFSYCNASHEPPYVIPMKDQVKKKDIKLLNEVTGPRLGDKSDAVYQSATIELNPNDRIVLYTDGVTDLKNDKGEYFGERALIKILMNCTNEKKDVSSTMGLIASEISSFRQNHPLQDDVTYFVVSKAS